MSPIFRPHPLPPRICPSPPRPLTRREGDVSGGEAAVSVGGGGKRKQNTRSSVRFEPGGYDAADIKLGARDCIPTIPHSSLKPLDSLGHLLRDL